MSTAIAPEPASDYRALAAQLRAAGLLDRRLGYYSVKIVLTLGAYATGWWALFTLGASWCSLGIAVLFGISWTQLGFLGHDAGHRQVFNSRRGNRLLGLVVGNCLTGLSFGWWVPKHDAHHAHPNEVGRDPDIGIGLVGHLPAGEGDGRTRRLAGWLAYRQAELFFPLMLLRSTGLYVSGVQDLLRRRDRARVLESLAIAAHGAFYLTAVFWVLSPAEAVAFIVVHQAVFSFYLGCSFAPNHKGMPLVEPDTEMSFTQRQVITARNIVGARCTGFVLGGLNYQIEHHLFPSMPRPNLRRARSYVRAFCIANGYGYCEAKPIDSYRSAIGHLRLDTIASLSSLEQIPSTG